MLAGLLVSIVAAAQPYTLENQSPFFQRLMAGPVPTEVDEFLFVYEVLRLARQDAEATRIYRLAERTVVRAMLGHAPEPVAGTLAAAAAADPPADLDELRREARMRSIVVVKDAPVPSAQHRALRNFSQLTVTAFEVLVAVPSAQDLLCKYEGALAPREVATVGCIPQVGPTRLEGGSYAVIAVRVQPGSYLNKGQSGLFPPTTVAMRARLAALPSEALERPAVEPVPAHERKEIYERWETGISLALIGVGFVVGWPIGAWHSRPTRPIRVIAVVTAVVALLAAVAGAVELSGVSRVDNTGGISTLIAVLVGIVGSLLAAAVWLGFNLGVWLGAWIGYRIGRRVTPA